MNYLELIKSPSKTKVGFVQTFKTLLDNILKSLKFTVNRRHGILLFEMCFQCESNQCSIVEFQIRYLEITVLLLKWNIFLFHFPRIHWNSVTLYWGLRQLKTAKCRKSFLNLRE